MTRPFIALDWGTTSFRATLVGADGLPREERASAEGIMAVADGGFEAVFERQVAGWDAGLAVLASGMIGSRQGWREAPYAEAPAGPAELAAGILRFRANSGREIAFVPGVSARGTDGVPDVMRGEETQIFGALAGAGGFVVTRGTHCKWVAMEAGRIAGFATFMTGELFAVLKSQSILGRLMTADAGTGPGFTRGVAAGLASGAGLLHALFSTRTLGLFGDVPGDQLASYLSGLLIGAEIAGARQLYPQAAEHAVTVIGAPALSEPFACAMEMAGLATQPAPRDAAVRGLVLLGGLSGVIA